MTKPKYRIKDRDGYYYTCTPSRGFWANKWSKNIGIALEGTKKALKKAMDKIMRIDPCRGVDYEEINEQ